jgi:hypothetical protein
MLILFWIVSAWIGHEIGIWVGYRLFGGPVQHSIYYIPWRA